MTWTQQGAGSEVWDRVTTAPRSLTVEELGAVVQLVDDIPGLIDDQTDATWYAATAGGEVWVAA